MTQKAHTPSNLYAYKNYVTDKQSFGFDEDGSRVGETPNVIVDAQTPNLACLFAAAPELLEACLAACPVLAEIGKNNDEAWGAYSFVLNAIAKAQGGAA